MPTPVHVPEPVWKTELPFTPPLEEFEPGLALAIGPGERDGVPTSVASIRYRMPDPVVRRYRGRVSQAIRVVAVDVADGEVYEGACFGQDYGPASFDPAADPEPAPGAFANGGAVNVDLLAVLGPPPHAARYAVFAWLDEWTSAPSLFELSADPKRAVYSIRRPANEPRVARAETAASGGSGAAVGLTSTQSVVTASWNAVDPSAVVLLGYGLEDRFLHWEVLARRDGPLAKQGRAEVVAKTFLDMAETGRAAFALMAGGQVKSILPAQK